MDEGVPGGRSFGKNNFGGGGGGGGGGSGGNAPIMAMTGVRPGPRKPAKIKNKQPAPLQITAEQILREAAERQEADFKPPKQRITDPEELEEYKYFGSELFIL